MPQEIGQVNKNLSHQQPVIVMLTALTEQRDEVRYVPKHCKESSVDWMHRSSL